ncbi:hypothetical protein [Xanthomonas phaseoli]|uniref:hypothetical protein n=1 Tax=Xanthomonas phaseoli TaxID=1985254 RepID=UPI001364D39D|nr:hypothetical protein [Xanthomonas phaseoli]
MADQDGLFRVSLGEFSDEQNGDGTGVWDNYDASSDSMTLNQSFTSLAENINGGGSPGAGDPNATLEDFAKKFSNFSASNIRPKLGWYCKGNPPTFSGRQKWS